MNQHVSNTMVSRRKKVLLWTPWGGQRVPDLDRALESTAQRPGKSRPRPDRPLKPGTAASKR